MDSRHQNGQTDTAIASIPLVWIYHCIRALHNFFSDHCGQKYGHKQSPKLAMHSENRYFVISNFHYIIIFFRQKTASETSSTVCLKPKDIKCSSEKNSRSRDEKKLFFSIFFTKNCPPRACVFWLLRIKNSKNGAHFCIFKNLVLWVIYLGRAPCFSIFEIVIFYANS